MVVGLGLIPLIDLWITSYRMNNAGYQYLQANLTSQEILALLKSAQPEVVKKASESGVPLKSQDIGYIFKSEFQKFNPQAEIKVSDYDLTNLYQVVIRLSWVEGTKRKQSVTYYILNFASCNFLKIGDL